MLPRISVSLLVSVGILATVSASAQDQTKLVKIRDSIYMAETASNVYVVTTPAGNVVIDTAPAKWAQDAKKVLSEEVHGPVKYIILTHGHADHIGGIDLWKESGTQIIAQRNYVEFVNFVRRLDGFFAPRNAVAFNRPPQEVSPWAGNYGAKVDPTILFDETYEFTLGGIEFKLFSTPGETPDHLTVWIPEYKTAFIGDNYAGVGIPEPMSFPNLYAIRGTKPRWALDWIHSIDTVLNLKPEVVLNGHGDPIVGKEEITRRLTRYRDAIQYVHDETVKGMNAGKDVYTLMQETSFLQSSTLANLSAKSIGLCVESMRDMRDGSTATQPRCTTRLLPLYTQTS